MPSSVRSSSRLWLRIADGMAVIILLATALLTLDAAVSRPGPQPRTVIAPGIETESVLETIGLVQRVTVDLRSPTITIELSPLNDETRDFRLVWLPLLAQQSQWDVAISGGDFSTRWGRYALAGQKGRPEFTLICEGRTVQRETEGAILWFDEHQTGHLDAAADPSGAWTAARWGLGGRRLCVIDGKINASMVTEVSPHDRRTVVGLDRTGCKLTLATFESATAHDCAEWLAAQGLWRAMELGTAENAGIVLNVPQAAVAKMGPRRFITHALGIRASRTQDGMNHAVLAPQTNR